jgi:hypothetical protein
MQDQSSSTASVEKPRPANRKKKIILTVLLVIICLVVLVIGLVPVWLSSSSGRSFIVNKVNQSGTGKLAIGDLSVGWLSGIDVADVSYSDQAAGMQVSVKRVSTEPHFLALLGGNVELGKTVIDKPVIEVALAPSTPKEPSAKASAAPEAKKESAGGLPIKMLDLTIKDGSVKVTSTSPGFQTVQLANIAAKVDIRPGDQKSDFNVAMDVESGGGKAGIKAGGSATGITQKSWHLTETTGDLNVQVTSLDLASLKGLLAAGGVQLDTAGTLNANITASVDNGSVKGVDIAVNGENLSVGGAALKGDTVKTSVFKVAGKVTSGKDGLTIQEAAVTADWLDITASGTIPTKAFSSADLLSPSSSYALKANVNCQVAKLLGQMPHMLGLKPGSQITSGRLVAGIDTAVTEGKRFISCDASIEDIQGIMDGKPVALSAPVKLAAKIVSDGKKPILDKGTFSASFGNIDCKGPFDNLDYTARLDLAALQSEAGRFVDLSGYSFAGKFDGTGNVAMNNGMVTATGKYTLANLDASIKGKQAVMQAVAIDHDVRYDSAKKVLSLNSVAVNADFGTLAVQKAQVTMGQTAAMELPVSAKIDFKKLMPLVATFGNLPKGMDLAGKLNAELTASQQGTVWHIVTRDVTVADFVMINPGYAPFVQKQLVAGFDGTVNPADASVSVRRLSLVCDAIKVNGNFDKTAAGTTSSLKGQLNTEYDLAAVSTLASPFVPGMTMKGSRKEDIVFSSIWPTAQSEKMMANMTAKAGLGFDEIKYMGMTFGKGDIAVTVDKGLLTIAPLSVPLNDGTLNFGATADFTKKPTFLVLSKPTAILNGIHITDEMVKFDKVKQYLNMIPVLGGASSISGTASLKCQEMMVPLGGAGAEAIVVAGTVDVNDLRANGTLLSGIGTALGRDIAAMTVMPTAFTLRDSVLKYNDAMKVLLAGETIEFRGWIGLNDKMDMAMTLPVRGTRVTVQLEGAASKPSFNLGKSVEKTILQSLPGILERGTKK